MNSRLPHARISSITGIPLHAQYIEKNVSKDYGTLVSYINFKRCAR